MSEPFVGEIRMLPYTYAPLGWWRCEGQTIQIQEATLLFAVIGTTYGGNGTTNFKLPNLVGRCVAGYKTNDLIFGNFGHVVGTNVVSIDSAQMAHHTHAIQAWKNTNKTTLAYSPDTTKTLAGAAFGGAIYNKDDSQNLTNMDPGMIGFAGRGEAHSNMQPFLGMYFCIAYDGIYPQRG